MFVDGHGKMLRWNVVRKTRRVGCWAGCGPRMLMLPSCSSEQQEAHFPVFREGLGIGSLRNLLLLGELRMYWTGETDSQPYFHVMEGRFALANCHQVEPGKPRKPETRLHVLLLSSVGPQPATIGARPADTSSHLHGSGRSGAPLYFLGRLALGVRLNLRLQALRLKPAVPFSS